MTVERMTDWATRWSWECVFRSSMRFERSSSSSTWWHMMIESSSADMTLISSYMSFDLSSSIFSKREITKLTWLRRFLKICDIDIYVSTCKSERCWDLMHILNSCCYWHKIFLFKLRYQWLRFVISATQIRCNSLHWRSSSQIQKMTNQ